MDVLKKFKIKNIDDLLVKVAELYVVLPIVIFMFGC